MEKSNKAIILSDKMINKLGKVNHFISKHLIDIHKKKEGLAIKFSYIDVADQEGMVSYLSTNKEIDHQTGKEIPENDKWVIKARTNVRVGAVIRSILLAKNIKFNDTDIEDFSNKFRTSSDEKFKFELVKGENIKKWYYHKNYAKGTNDNSLHNSCMRYKNCGTFFTIYANNDNVSLLVCIDSKTNKLLARGVVWHDMYISGVKKTYVDRIYCYDDRFLSTVKDYIFSQGWWCKDRQSNDNSIITNGKTPLNNPSMKVSIPLMDWDAYKKPYMDTMKYMKEDVLKGKLVLTLNNKIERGTYKETWTSTCGGHGINHGYASIFDRFAILSKHLKADFNDVNYNKEIFTVKGKQYSLVKINGNISNLIKNNADCLVDIDFTKFINVPQLVTKNANLIYKKYSNKIDKIINSTASIKHVKKSEQNKMILQWLENKNNFDSTVDSINKRVTSLNRDRYNWRYGYGYGNEYGGYGGSMCNAVVINGTTKNDRIHELVTYTNRNNFALYILLDKMDANISKQEVVKNMSTSTIKDLKYNAICGLKFNLSTLGEIFNTKDREVIFDNVKSYLELRYVDWNSLDSKFLTKILTRLGFELIAYKKSGFIEKYALKEIKNKVAKKAVEVAKKAVAKKAVKKKLVAKRLTKKKS